MNKKANHNWYGYIGLPLAVEFSNIMIIGYDINKKIKEICNNYKSNLKLQVM